jgi:O-antigen/teichoic acid export membrane protein
MLIGLTPELTRFMVGPAYQSASEFVIWGVLAEGARVISGVYSLAAHAKMKTRLLLWPNIISAVVCIGFIWILVPAYGAHGIGMARVFAGISMLVAMHIMMIVVLDMQLPYWMLLKGVVMGVALLCIVMLGRWVLGGANSAMGAGLLIMFTGLVFLPMFYWLLFPFLPRHDMTL